MILITVGTEKFSFDRLMHWIDRLITTKSININEEEVVIQYGSCTFIPNGTKSYSLLPESEFQELLKKARLIIAHCGEGTLDALATTNKPFILIPRSHKFGEHVDDHQVELADRLAENGIPIAYTLQDLAQFVQSPKEAKVTTIPTNYYARASQLLESEFSTLVMVKKKFKFDLIRVLQILTFFTKPSII